MQVDPSRPTELSLAGLVRSGAVVQMDRPVMFRGQARPGATVRVTLADQQATTQADARTGRWRCELEPIPVGGPYDGQVESQGQSLRLEQVHCGQLWLCAGQSNMAMSLSALEPDERPSREEAEHVVRFTAMPMRVAASPLADGVIQWDDALARPAQASGVGSHFALSLANRLRMPVGFVQSAVGHTPAMAWMARKHVPPGGVARQKLQWLDRQLAQEPDAQADLQARYLRTIAPQMKQWNRQTSDWLPVARQAYEAGQPIPPLPAYPDDLGNPHTPTLLHNGMLAPLAGERFAGLLWYQGESDALLGYEDDYERSLLAVVASVRDLVGDVPAVIVELPRHHDIQCPRPDDAWPSVRWAQQRVALSADSFGLVPTMDLGDTSRIHPTRKKRLAHRAADIALALVYPGQVGGLPHGRHGPAVDRIMVQPGGLAVRFKGVAGKLMMMADESSNHACFEVLTHGQWRVVVARLAGEREVWLRHEGPVEAVRYAWRGDPRPGLVDEQGWPVSGFCMTVVSG